MPDGKKLALHRSIIFWSGLLVMAFICWAWWASMQAGSYLQSGRWALRNSMAGMSIESMERRSIFPAPPFSGALHEPHRVRFSIERLPSLEWVGGDAGLRRPGMNGWRAFVDESLRARDHRNYLELRMRLASDDDWILFIPHWLLLLLTAGLWFGLLLWRAKLRNRTINLQNEA